MTVLTVLSEVVIALMLGAITVALMRQRRRIRPRHRGFDMLLAGLVLISLAAVLDVLEPQLSAWLPPGTASATVGVEMVAGYILGLALTGAGIILWVPALVRYQHEVFGRLDAEEALRKSKAELQARNEVLQLLNELAERLHRTLDVEAVAREAVAVLIRHSQPPLVAVYLVEPDGGQLRLVAEHGFDAETLRLGQRLAVAGSLSGAALAERRLLKSDDIAGDDRLDRGMRDRLVAQGVVSAMVIPMFFQKEPLGTINLIYRWKAEFGRRDLDAFTAIGRTVALALVNARHFADLEHQAFHDSLTGLANRMALHRDVARLLGAGARDRGLALVLVDLDRFKEINEALGHRVGDELLIQVGPRISESLGGRAAPVFRLGGDEFAVVLAGVDGGAEAEAAAWDVVNGLRRPFLVRSLTVAVGSSAGVAVLPAHGRDSHELLRCADIALTRAKDFMAGVAVYRSELDRSTPERLGLVAELGDAIRDDRLTVYLQPKVALADGRIAGFEALVRWRHPRRGLLEPDDFIPLAEVSDVIHPLTCWVLDTALAQLQRWRAMGRDVTVSVNMSVRNLGDPACAARLREVVLGRGVEPSAVEIEITETALMSDPETAVRTLAEIAAVGVRIAIDDFGTGYSSLAYLTRFNAHAIKIDRGFVGAMLHDESALTIVRSTVNMAHDLGLEVVAEGVEDWATARALRELGCDLAQGFVFARPAPVEEAERLVVHGSGRTEPWTLS